MPVRDSGARVIAVSTIDGALVDPAGLDVEELLVLCALHGDAFVRHGPVSARSPRGALRSRVRLLVPGARPHVIAPESADDLRCAAVVPAANVPYAPGATDVLAARGILALPDFVTNAGGIHLYEAPECQDIRPPGRSRAARRETTGRVLAAADAGRITPTEAALEIARDYLRAAAS